MSMRRATAAETPYLWDGPDGGDVVLCLHGFPDVPQTWNTLATALASRGYRVVCPWLPGYFPSPAPGPIDFDAVADKLMKLADALSPYQPVRLVGHDWGAVLSYRMLSRDPERFYSAVMMSVPHPGVFVSNLMREPVQLRRSWYMMFFQLGRFAGERVRRDHYALIDQLWRDWSPGWTAPASHMELVKDCLSQSDDGPLRYYRALLNTSTRRLFREITHADARITVPTLYLHGEQDGCIGRRLSVGQDRFFERGLETVHVPHAGHFLHLEQPDEVVGRIARCFGRPR